MSIRMNTPLRPARLLPCLALLTLVASACSESDLEELHDGRLDDALAAREAETAATPPATASGSESPTEPGTVPAPELGAAVPGAALPDADDYVLVFSDEFRALSLDASRWSTSLPWGPDVTINDERQYYADALGGADDGAPVERSPFSFDGESLTITASEIGDAPGTPEAARAAGNGLDWLSGVLTTAEKFDFTYGHVEIRVDMPEGQGLWPWIWMLGAEPIDRRPQLYVMERDGARADSLFHNYEYVDENGDLRSPGQFEVVEEGLSEGFHTVGVTWSPEEFLFHLDGVPRYRVVGADVSRQDMYLALGLAIGGTWPGAPDETTPRPLEWTIDYVRVWQKDGVEETSAP